MAQASLPCSEWHTHTATSDTTERANSRDVGMRQGRLCPPSRLRARSRRLERRSHAASGTPTPQRVAPQSPRIAEPSVCARVGYALRLVYAHAQDGSSVAPMQRAAHPHRNEWHTVAGNPRE
ncbi:hypothetical protein B0H19DRAFT_1276856 [Mycena capillaripes]|nr:hypothetical protein B0H19DRAFT_1276856 [Mycena capillaripes]